MAAPKMAKISTKNTPNKKYGGEDTLTPKQRSNRSVRDSRRAEQRLGGTKVRTTAAPKPKVRSTRGNKRVM